MPRKKSAYERLYGGTENITPEERARLERQIQKQQEQLNLSREKEGTIQPPPEAKVTEPEISEVEGSGGKRVTLTLPGQETLVGIPKNEALALIENWKSKQIPEDFAQVGAAQQRLQQQMRLQEAIANIGKVGGLTATEEAAINWSQAFTAGAAAAVPGVTGGAAAGLGIGLLATGGTLSVPAAVGTAALAGIGTFIAGTLRNIREQQAGELAAADAELTAARTNMRQLAMLASRDPGNADVYITLYNEQLTRVYQAERQTQLETAGDLNAWMEDGRDQGADFTVFLRDGGIADIYGQKLAVALQTGTPLSVMGDDLVLTPEEE